MANEIGPALTPEEWEDGGEGVVDGYMDLDAGIVDVNSHYSKNPERFRHALAALCLHGQPFGFTRDHVRALRELGHPSQTTESQDLAYEAIALIEALLPPEGD